MAPWAVHHGDATRGTASYLEEIIAGHARLAGHTSGDDDEIRSAQSISKVILLEPLLHQFVSKSESAQYRR